MVGTYDSVSEAYYYFYGSLQLRHQFDKMEIT